MIGIPILYFLLWKKKFGNDIILDDSISFKKVLPTVLECPIKNHGKSDIYIDNETMIIAVIGNEKKQGKAATPLATHVIGYPVDNNASIPSFDLI